MARQIYAAGRKGNPAQALNRPSTSLTTSRASPVFRHQLIGIEGSSETPWTMASPLAPESCFQRVRVRGVDFRGHQDHAARVALERAWPMAPFHRRYNDGRLQDTNCGFGDAFVDKDELVVGVFPW